MNGNDPVLEFADVTLSASPPLHSGLSRVDARLFPGTLTIIRLEAGNERLPIADLAEGLLLPEQGSVMFMGDAWNATAAERALRRRALIGRVFDERGWISNLNVDENVTLSQRHHTRRPIAEILAEVGTLARAFGLDGVPGMRPEMMPHQDLRRAEWVRAFLGRPVLVLLERPMRGVSLEHLPRLMNAVHEARARGAAVLWLTDSDFIARHPESNPGARYAMKGLALTMLRNG